MRVTLHFGRCRKDGTAFTPRHNDRDFERMPKHIDAKRTPLNIVRKFTDGDGTINEGEYGWYASKLSAMLETRNQRRIRQRKLKDVWSVEQLRSNPKYCPEEWILQVGKLKETIDRELLDIIGQEYVSWHRKRFPQCHILSTALHCDERGAPHIHGRQVWTYTDKDGNLNIGQEQALKEMGIERPNLDAPSDSKNNRKITYTAMCRETLQNIARKYGIEVETDRQAPGEVGLKLMEYKARERQRALDEAQKQIKDANEQARQYTDGVADAERKRKEIKAVDKRKSAVFGKVLLAKDDYEMLLAAADNNAKAEALLAEVDALRRQLDAAKKNRNDVVREANRRLDNAKARIDKAAEREGKLNEELEVLRASQVVQIASALPKSDLEQWIRIGDMRLEGIRLRAKILATAQAALDAQLAAAAPSRRRHGGGRGRGGGRSISIQRPDERGGRSLTIEDVRNTDLARYIDREDWEHLGDIERADRIIDMNLYGD